MKTGRPRAEGSTSRPVPLPSRCSPCSWSSGGRRGERNSMPGEHPPAATHRSPITPFRLALGLIGLVGLGLVWVWVAYRSGPVGPPHTPAPEGPADPRRTYTGPYRNIDPDVRYVGDARCADCHAEISHSYARHPMGRSLSAVAELAERQRYSPDTKNPFTALGRRFEVDRQGKRVWHRQAVVQGSKPVIERAQEVHWAIGSGQRGYSYLTEQDGYLLQTPISWFTQKQRWDLSPGFGPSALAARVVQASCLFCHVNRALEHPDHPDRFLPPIFAGHAIGCERCHGPAELHVTGDMDHTIVNPARLSPPLRNAVCEQCHLEGEARVLRSGRGLFDYRPGLALHEFWAVLVPSPVATAPGGGEDARAVNHVEQMYLSRCFLRSEEKPALGKRKLGCTSCHDPHQHVGPEQRLAHYRARCL